MVDALRTSGRICSGPVEQAFRAVPRHAFLPGTPIEAAYADEALTVQRRAGVATSSASQPSMMAIMLEQLDLRPGHRVLEIGAGTGYNAALMAHVVGAAGSVTAVDIDAELVSSAAAHLAAAGMAGVELICADGALGHPPRAPYDRIVLTVCSVDVRPEWVAQLAEGGRLLLPLAVLGSQLSVALDLGADGILRSGSVRGCSFIRLRGIGAGSDATVRPVDGLLIAVPESRGGVDPHAVAAALAAPGPARRLPVSLGASDVWDGFGLWLALTEPGTVRLLAHDDHPFSARMFAPGPAGGVTVALVVDAGLAVVLRGNGTGDGTGDGTVDAEVQAFGPGGATAAELVLAAARRWVDGGSPSSAELEVAVVPRGHPVPWPGAARVDKEHSTVQLRPGSR